MADRKKNDLVGQADKSINVLSLAWDLGWVLIVPVLIGVVVGRWFDSKLGTVPWLTLILIVGGAILGFSAMIWKAKKVTEK